MFQEFFFFFLNLKVETKVVTLRNKFQPLRIDFKESLKKLL